jgi:hypothetical protein
MIFLLKNNKIFALKNILKVLKLNKNGTRSIDRITFFRNLEVVLSNNILLKLDGCSFEFINQPNLT